VTGDRFYPGISPDYFTTPVKMDEGKEIGGSPFVFDDWLLANIRFMDDKKVIVSVSK
jgi:hypothetical protein